jgi:hypothetical protein
MESVEKLIKRDGMTVDIILRHEGSKNVVALVKFLGLPANRLRLPLAARRR